MCEYWNTLLPREHRYSTRLRFSAINVYGLILLISIRIKELFSK